MVHRSDPADATHSRTVYRFSIALVAISLTVPPTVRAGDDAFHFENQIVPLLSRCNCNSSGCHGKAEGQGGFKLSVFGFDPTADHASIVKEGRGRRVMATAAADSLFLRKATGRTPHGGGTRLKLDSKDYLTLRDWIAAGTPVGDPNAPQVVSLRVEPTEALLRYRVTQPLKAFAKYSDGREVDVTDHARFQTNNESLATVGSDGVIATLDSPGEVAIMAAYLGQVSVCRVIIPRPGAAVATKLPQFNLIDKHVDRKLAKLNVSPSAVCDDAEFLRRVHLDLVGLPPTPDEARAFLKSTEADKRAKLIEQLLTEPAFADLMALRWADLLRVNRQVLGPQKAFAYYRWIRESFAANQPFDHFARELLTAEGPLTESAAANFYKVVTKPGDAASTISQVFLGVRIACAECHHHPTDRWSQADYAGMVGLFTPLTFRGGKDAESLLAVGDPVTKHPRSGVSVAAHALGTKEPSANPTGDRRLVLADWMTEPSNPYFARNFVNRLWANLLGRGIVEPVDDVRATNPPSNADLLDALATERSWSKKYDVRELVMRLICRSRVYQTSSTPNDTNEKDEQNFSRGRCSNAPSAEVLLDLIGTARPACGIGSPASQSGTRAVQVWDSQTKHEFLKLFGRPSADHALRLRAEPRSRVPSQVLNLLNSPDASDASSAHEAGTIGPKLVAAIADDGKVIEELYLTAFYSRLPDCDTERAKGVEYLSLEGEGGSPPKAAEDLSVGDAEQPRVSRSTTEAVPPREDTAHDPVLRRPDPPRLPCASAPPPSFGLPFTTAEPVAGGSEKATAKRDVSLIFVFLHGGLSTIDTFDLKPDAPAEFRGAVPAHQATKLPGLQVCEHLPKAWPSRMDKFSLVRSFTAPQLGPRAGRPLHAHRVLPVRPGSTATLSPEQPAAGVRVDHLQETRPARVGAALRVPAEVPPELPGRRTSGPGHAPFVIDADPSAAAISACPTWSRRP